MELENLKKERFTLFFEELKKHIGEKVVIEFVYTNKENSLLYKNPAVLKNVLPFNRIQTQGIFCPRMQFLGPKYTIVRITTKYGKTIYDNRQVLECLPIEPTLDNLNELSLEIFGVPYISSQAPRKDNFCYWK